MIKRPINFIAVYQTERKSQDQNATKKSENATSTIKKEGVSPYHSFASTMNRSCPRFVELVVEARKNTGAFICPSTIAGHDPRVLFFRTVLTIRQ